MSTGSSVWMMDTDQNLQDAEKKIAKEALIKNRLLEQIKQLILNRKEIQTVNEKLKY